MKDRTNEEGIDPVTDKPTDDAGRRGELESRGGEKHGTPQERTMIEEILDPENYAAAWQRVKANKGAPGIDGMTVEAYPAFAQENWARIAIAISEGNYRPAPVKRAWIILPAERSAKSLRKLMICASRRAVRSPTGPNVR
jgi:RNA-directed DNA polymerase